MSDLTPERLDLIRSICRHSVATSDKHPLITMDAADVLALLDAAAERDALAESVRAYGRTIDRWGSLIIAATHSEDITTPDGDGDWEVIESRLAEVPALLAERDALAAAVERVRALPIGPPSGGYYMVSMRDVRDTLDATPDTGGES